MRAGDTLILGLGNELISDDGFGPAVIEELRSSGAGSADLPHSAILDTASVAGFRLLDLLNGFRRALLLDVVRTGAHEPGTLMEWPLPAGSAGRTLGGSHQMDPATALAFGRRVGYALPESVTLLVAEAEDLETIRDELTPGLRAAVPKAAALAREWLSETGAFSPANGRNHGQTRIVS